MTVYQDGYIKWIRERIGHELIFLVYANAVIVNDDGHILAQRRYEFDWWDLVGGAKEIEETIAACAVREAKEESGLDIEIVDIIGVYSDPAYTVRYPHGDLVQPWTVSFLCRHVGGEIEPDGQETLAAEFKPLHELVPHPLPIFDHILRDAFSGTRKGMLLEPPVTTADTTPFFPKVRAVVGNDPLILPGANVVVWDADGRILVVWRPVFETWDLPGGLTDLGENTTYTAIRETLEETGILIQPKRALGVYSAPEMMRSAYPNGDVVYGVSLLIEAEAVGGEIKADGQEVTQVAFKSLAELRAQDTISPFMNQIWMDIANLEHCPFIR